MSVVAAQDVAVSSRSGQRPVLGGMLVAAAVLLSALSLRVAVVSFSPLAERVTEALGLGKVYIGVFGMLPPALFAAGGLVAPWLMGRIGLESTVLAGMVATGAGMLARAFAPNGWMLLACTAIALGGMGTTNVVLPPLVKKHFPARIALMSALYVTLLQIGTAAPAFVAIPLADSLGWRGAIGVWSAVGFLAALPWLFVRRRENGGAARVVRGDILHGVWRTRLGWAMAVLFGTCAMVSYAMFAWVAPVLTSAGASPAFAGSMVGVLPVLGMALSLVAPVAVTRMANPFPVLAACALGALLGFAGLWAAPTTLTVLWVMLIGFGMCTFPIVLVLINLRARTHAGSAALSGFTQGVGYVISCLGPLLFGLLHTLTGGWGASFALMALATVAGAIAAWTCSRAISIEDQVAGTARRRSRLTGRTEAV
ncbi:MAG: MFS transporter [Mycobacteriaceae bacterium]|nr:MFS transporter [Mycobacteriaceae bacterium]